MKTCVKILITAGFVMATCGLCYLSSRMIGPEWTALILFNIAFAVNAWSYYKFTTRKRAAEFVLDSLKTITMLDQIQEIGKVASLDPITTILKPDNEQPGYADLNPEQQVMKGEENALRIRLKETIKFRDSSQFKSWPEEKQNALCVQIGAMTLYHTALLSRCIVEGVLLKNEAENKE